MSGPNVPVISLELLGMKASVKVALMEYVTDLKDQIDEAVERICTPVYVTEIINREVATVLGSVVREEVERFYRTGAGRSVVRQVVEEKLG